VVEYHTSVANHLAATREAVRLEEDAREADGQQASFRTRMVDVLLEA
jgi:hypothetical protein